MSDPLRPYGADTLIIPFQFIRAGPSRRVGADRALPSSDDLADDGPRRSYVPVRAHSGLYQEPGRAVSVASDLAASNVSPDKHFDQPPSRFGLDVHFGRSPYDTAAIDFDPREVGLTPAANEVNTIIERVTREVVQAADGEFDQTTRQIAGIKLHDRLAKALQACNIPGVSVEETIAPDSEIKNYGQDGAKRTDITYRDASGNVQAIWDYKVGNASLTRRRAQDLIEYATGVANKPVLARQIPVIEIKACSETIG